MKRLRLDNNRVVTVSDGAYEEIVKLVETWKVCGMCEQRYVSDLPQVAQNLCLECFQRKCARLGLTYVGAYTANSQGDSTHLFMDSTGVISLTSTASESEPKPSAFQTLMYWEFPVPKYVMRGKEQVELNTWHWHIYGDVRNNSVLYIAYDPRSGDEKPVAFLTYKRGDTEEVNRRLKRFQRLFQEARSRLKATKDECGYYQVNGHKVAGISDAAIYEMIAAIASSERDLGKEEAHD